MLMSDDNTTVPIVIKSYVLKNYTHSIYFVTMFAECAKCHDLLVHDEDSLECTECMDKLHFIVLVMMKIILKSYRRNKIRDLHVLDVKKTGSGTKTKIPDDNLTSDSKLEELIVLDNFLINKFDDFNKQINFVLKEIKDLKLENSKLIIKNEIMKKLITWNKSWWFRTK